MDTEGYQSRTSTQRMSVMHLHSVPSSMPTHFMILYSRACREQHDAAEQLLVPASHDTCKTERCEHALTRHKWCKLYQTSCQWCMTALTLQHPHWGECMPGNRILASLLFHLPVYTCKVNLQPASTTADLLHQKHSKAGSAAVTTLSECSVHVQQAMLLL